MARYPHPPRSTEKLHKLDKEREQCMKNAENKCSKRRMGGVDFSPEVIVWKNRSYVWNSVIRCHKGAKINRAIIKVRAKACGIQRPLGISLTESNRVYKICSDEFKILKPYADIYMERFLTRRVK